MVGNSVVMQFRIASKTLGFMDSLKRQGIAVPRSVEAGVRWSWKFCGCPDVEISRRAKMPFAALQSRIIGHEMGGVLARTHLS